MANKKYDNLTVLMTTGGLKWVADPIVALLTSGVVFDATDVTTSDLGGPRYGAVPVPRRSVSPEGALLGGAVSFNSMPKDVTFQMLIVKDAGPNNPAQLLTFYDVDDGGNPLRLNNNGTLIVRPDATMPDPDTGAGTWVAI